MSKEKLLDIQSKTNNRKTLVQSFNSALRIYSSCRKFKNTFLHFLQTFDVTEKSSCSGIKFLKYELKFSLRSILLIVLFMLGFVHFNDNMYW